MFYSKGSSAGISFVSCLLEVGVFRKSVYSILLAYFAYHLCYVFFNYNISMRDFYSFYLVSLYGFNLSMTTIAFMVNVLAQFFESVLPSDLELPEAVRLPAIFFNTNTFQTKIVISLFFYSWKIKVLTLPEKLRLGQLFHVKGLSFDPQLWVTRKEERPQLKLLQFFLSYLLHLILFMKVCHSLES